MKISSRPLGEYVSRMKEDQKDIYYACGDSLTHIQQLPQTELLRDKGYEILYLTDNVDEFALRMLGSYQEKTFKNISSDDLDLGTEEEKKETEQKVEENKDLLNFMKDSLDGKVKAVVLSQRLKSHPVCISTEGAVTLEMEKVLNAMPGNEKVTAQRVLEINVNHPIFRRLQSLYEGDKAKVKEYTQLLYTQAMLIEGFPVEDPVAYTNKICELMVGRISVSLSENPRYGDKPRRGFFLTRERKRCKITLFKKTYEGAHENGIYRTVG